MRPFRSDSYIDPTDFTQTEADMRAVWDKAGVKNGQDLMAKAMEQMPAATPAGVRAEAREVERVQRGGFAELREGGEAPDVPTVILLAGKLDPQPPGNTFSGDYERHGQATLEQRLDHFGRLANRASNGTLVRTSKSGHFIHLTEPELAVWAIGRVLSLASPHPELERFTGEYRLTPAFAMKITRVGDKLALQATGQPSFPMVAESATTFSIQAVGAGIEFETDAAGNVTALVLVQNGARQRAPRVGR